MTSPDESRSVLPPAMDGEDTLAQRAYRLVRERVL